MTGLRLTRFQAALLFAFLLVSPATAEEIPKSLLPGSASATDHAVARVIDGDTLVLKSPLHGADQVRLVGLQAPKLPLGRKDYPTWPLAPESKRALEALTLGRRVRLFYGGSRKDRHGRILAHLQTTDGVWVQGEMLSLGMARVYTFPDNRTAAADMLALEQAARKAGRGIWGHPFYAVRDGERAGDVSRLAGTFQIIEGRVTKAEKVKSRIYLNFGQNWRDDFTITLQTRARRMFTKAGLDPLAFAGKRVRVRGWLKKRNGPVIEATHPEQIEIVDR
ncbi:MAG: thermonuclease family protein [Rhodospirillales bacterium]|nr:thermonuclease family protein [Alphaproteobacteria bacterium]MBL6947083.1 thermonuclease family protein [Rhodospirillales bacterium]